MDSEEEASPAYVAALKGSVKKAPAAAQMEPEQPDDNKAMLGEICDALQGLSSEPGTDPKMAQALMQACQLLEPYATKYDGGDQGEGDGEENEVPPMGTDNGEA